MNKLKLSNYIKICNNIVPIKIKVDNIKLS